MKSLKIGSAVLFILTIIVSIMYLLDSLNKPDNFFVALGLVGLVFLVAICEVCLRFFMKRKEVRL